MALAVEKEVGGAVDCTSWFKDQRDKTMVNKLMFVPNDDTQNDEICNLKKGGNIVYHCIGERGFGNLNSLLKSN